MTRKPRPRPPLTPAERAALEPALLHLLREARRPDFSVYTNRADFAQAFGILEGLVKVGLLTEQEAAHWRYELEGQAENLGPNPAPEGKPAPEPPSTPVLAVEESIRRVIKTPMLRACREMLQQWRERKPPLGYYSGAMEAYGAVKDAMLEALFGLLEEVRKAEKT